WTHVSTRHLSGVATLWRERALDHTRQLLVASAAPRFRPSTRDGGVHAPVSRNASAPAPFVAGCSHRSPFLFLPGDLESADARAREARCNRPGAQPRRRVHAARIDER